MMDTEHTAIESLLAWLHAKFTGEIEIRCVAGQVTSYVVTETVKPGRVPVPDLPTPQRQLIQDDLALLIQDGEAGFTGTIRLHCHEGGVARYARVRQVSLAASTELRSFTSLAESTAPTPPPSAARRARR